MYSVTSCRLSRDHLLFTLDYNRTVKVVVNFFENVHIWINERVKTSAHALSIGILLFRAFILYVYSIQLEYFCSDFN